MILQNAHFQKIKLSKTLLSNKTKIITMSVAKLFREIVLKNKINVAAVS